jgi:hypothetical protein
MAIKQRSLTHDGIAKQILELIPCVTLTLMKIKAPDNDIGKTLVKMLKDEKIVKTGIIWNGPK